MSKHQENQPAGKEAETWVLGFAKGPSAAALLEASALPWWGLTLDGVSPDRLRSQCSFPRSLFSVLLAVYFAYKLFPSAQSTAHSSGPAR